MNELFCGHQPDPTIFIFGGSGTIGSAIVREFAVNDWRIGLQYYHNTTAVEQTSTFLGQQGKTLYSARTDVRDPVQIRSILGGFFQQYGSLHVLIWAVGATLSKLVVQTEPTEWHDTLQTNLTAAFYALKEAAPFFERQRHGTVIFVGSLSAEQGVAGQAAYAASKAGLIGLMKSAAKEWGHLNIRLNAVFPGWHASPLSHHTFESALQQTPHALQRTPSLKEVAKTVYHLASTEDVSGQVWNLDSRIW